MFQNNTAPLSTTQMGIYADSMAFPESTLYNLPLLGKLGKDINTGKLKAAIEAAAKAHPSLNARIFMDETGQIMQRISDEPIRVDVIEMSDEEFRLRRENLVRPFELLGGRLYCFEIYVTPSGRYWFQDVHHVISDATSLNILSRDVRAAYDGNAVEPEPYTGLDLALDEADALETDAYARARAYYSALLDGRDTDSLPVRDVFEKTPRQEWLTQEFTLNEETFRSLRREAGVSTGAFFTGIMGFLIAKYNYSNESVIATVYSGRSTAQTDRTFSMLVKTLPFVTDISGNPAIRDLLRKATEDLVGSRGHSLYSFAELAAEYGVTSNVSFGYQGRILEYQLMDGADMQVEHIYDEKHVQNTALLMEISDLGGGKYAIHLGYRADMFSKNYAENLAGAYAKIAQEFLEKEFVDDVELADAQAAAQIEIFNRKEYPYDREKTVIDLFREQAALRPDHLALVHLNHKYTYKQLDEITDRLAMHLRRCGIEREKAVGVLIPRCEYMVICSLAVLKAGGAYVPLDPTYPPERLNLMVQDSGAKVLITTPELNEIISDDHGCLRMMTNEIVDMQDIDEELPEPKPEDLFVLLYTSGSTGVPKGVMLEHGNVAALCNWAVRYYELDETAVSAEYASYGFDAHMNDTYPPLISGGTVHIIDESIRLDLVQLQKYFNAQGITHTTMTTQVGRQFALMDGTESLRHMTVGGEKLVPFDPPAFSFHNGYGPTEGCMCASVQRLDRKYEDVPIGPVLDNFRAYVVDQNGKLLPVGAAGELWISGRQVARGYLNRQEQTAQAFTKNSFCSREDYERVYHTGDVVRYMTDGRLQFIGRRDSQVKVRGFRIELTEVEEVIRRFPGIKDATVAAFDNPSGGKYIAAYIVADVGISIDALNRFIQDEKPPYMVPAVTMQIDAIPMTQNQKVNKRALPKPVKQAAVTIAPETDMQKKLFACVADAVGHEDFGITTDIYDAGLTSIGAIRLNVLISKQFDITIKTSDLKSNPTILQLEQFVQHCGSGREYEIWELYPLTNAQMGVFADSAADPDSTVYNIPSLFELDQQVDLFRLRDAVIAAVEAHPYLKMQLTADGAGEICQKRNDALAVTVQIMDGLDRDALARPFLLYDAPLYRFEIHRTPEANYFFMDVHHIAADGTSLAVLLEDINRAYSGQALQRETYSGYEAALDYEQTVQSDAYAEAEEFFNREFCDCDGDTGFYPDMAGDCPCVNRHRTEDAANTPAAVRTYCEKHGITENVFFMGVFGALLAKYNYSDEAVFTTIYHGRNDSRLVNAVAMLVKTLPVRTQLSGDTSEYFARLRDLLLGSMDHDCYPFSEISRSFAIQPNALFAYQGDSFVFDEIGGCHAERIPLELNAAKEPVLLQVFIENGRFVYDVEYRSDLFSSAFVEGLVSAYKQAVGEFIAKDNLHDIELADEASRLQIDIFNQTEHPFDREKTVIDLFREQARLHPDNTAVVYLKTQYTYKQLDEITDRLAMHLRRCGIEREKVVGVLIPRCEYMAICSLGVLKAGGAYLPLDPTYPPERLNLMMQDSGAQVLITTPELSGIISDEHGYLRIMTAEIPDMQDVGEELSAPKNKDLFVMLYTSGSTGVPKGVMLEHGNLAAFCAWAKQYYDIDETAVFALYASYGFDAHMQDMYPALTNGGCLHIIDESIRLDLVALQKYFNDNGVTNTLITTQVGRQFAQLEGTKTLKHLIVGGEKLVPLDPPSYNFYNAYGPTEGTIIATIAKIDRRYDDMPIGPALNNLKLYVVDKQGKLLPVGASGELWIAGPQVSRGYLNRPEQTEKAFTKNPFCDHPDYGRVYHTGDVVRFMQDGTVQFIGRRDSQVKIRGFRIELTEVEEVIRRYPGIKDATVVARDAATGGKMLVAYVVSGEPVDIKGMNAFILQEKPPYMVPAVTMQIDAIPLNANSKVDKRKLPEPKFAEAETAPETNRAQTRLEEEISDVLASVLGHRDFGVETDFAYAGLTSISAIRLAAELNKQFGFGPNVKELLGGANILTVENALVENWRTASYAKPEQKAVSRDSYPLTQTQLGIYLECMMDAESDMYNIPMVLKLDASIDADRLERAIRDAVEAHPFLKCRIESRSDGGAVMIPRDDYAWQVVRTVCAEDEVEARFGRLAHTITLESDALFAFEIVCTEACVYLRMNFHHIIMDGSSVNVLLQDIEIAYMGEKLTAEAYTAFDLALDEEESRNSESYAKAKAYYDSVFDGVSVHSLPAADVTDLPEGEAILKFPMPKLAEADVQAFCTAHSITPNALFTAAFGVLLGKLNGRDEAVFASIYNGRTDPRTFGMLGMLVRTYPIYMNIEGTRKVDDFVGAVRESISGLTANDLFSFAEASRAYGVNSDIIFAYQGDEFNTATFAGKPVKVLETRLESAKAPLNVDVLYGEDGYAVNFEYRRDLYAADSILWMADAYTQIVRGMLRAETLADVDPASEAAHTWLEEINDTAWPVAFRPACTLMEHSAARHPDRLAITTAEEKLTYSQLNAKANRLAHGLAEASVQSGSIVALMLPRSAQVYVTRQGILKAGAAFLTIDPKYPDDRIAYMLEDSGAAALITDSGILRERHEFLTELHCAVLDVSELLTNENEHNPGIDRAPDDLCYCIYTSGSTGKPKGVMLSQRNLVNFVDANPKNHEILGYTQRASVSLAQAAFTFDVSIMEEFIPLANGMTVCMAGEEEIHNPVALAALMQTNHVDMMSCTPSFLANMIDLDVMRGPLAKVASYDFGAEAFPPSLFGKIRAINPGAYIMNGYGPTEATISCTMDVVTDPRRITIGRPNANVKAYVVDEKLHILPPRMCGELVICGDGVGIGYIGRDGLNREKFISLNGMRAYRTGDLAEYTYDGQLLFHGRTDNQIKLRGLRVELGEIESAINAYPGVITSIVLPCGEGDRQFLAAWYTASCEIPPAQLQAEIGKTLTHYMVPGVLTQLDVMPLTANGKIDKHRLPKPEYIQPERICTPPANPVEKDFCELFGEILQLEQVGAEDNFFGLGGTSLSASRVAMFAMEKGYRVVYADVFKHPTPRGLASLVLGEQIDIPHNPADVVDYDYDKLDHVLAGNVRGNLDEIKGGPIGNVLITGATGFLAIHVLWRYLESCEGTAYCLLRKGKMSSVEKRLRAMLVYYFSDDFETYFDSGRIRCIEGDITQPDTLSQLDELEFNTLINCAALVKHFDAGDGLERVNVQGVKNLIACCMRKNRRLIQISTVSVAGESVNGLPDAGKQLYENDLFFGQLLENDYVRSKFYAERAVLEAISNGLDAKIMRVGNLMARHTDGEFQINFRSSGFMRQLQGYKVLGGFPMSGMYDPVEFSEIGMTAEAILRLSGTDSKFTVFHPCNNHLVTMADVIYIMQQHGFEIDVVSDQKFLQMLNAAAEDPRMSDAVGGLIAYANSEQSVDRRILDSSLRYTTEALFRLGFKWPITSPDYLRNMIDALDGLGMF